MDTCLKDYKKKQDNKNKGESKMNALSGILDEI